MKMKSPESISRLPEQSLEDPFEINYRLVKNAFRQFVKQHDTLESVLSNLYRRKQEREDHEKNVDISGDDAWEVTGINIIDLAGSTFIELDDPDTFSKFVSRMMDHISSEKEKKEAEEFLRYGAETVVINLRETIFLPREVSLGKMIVLGTDSKPEPRDPQKIQDAFDEAEKEYLRSNIESMTQMGTIIEDAYRKYLPQDDDFYGTHRTLKDFLDAHKQGCITEKIFESECDLVNDPEGFIPSPDNEESMRLYGTLVQEAIDTMNSMITDNNPNAKKFISAFTQKLSAISKDHRTQFSQWKTDDYLLNKYISRLIQVLDNLDEAIDKADWALK